MIGFKKTITQIIKIMTQAAAAPPPPLSVDNMPDITDTGTIIGDIKLQQLTEPAPPILVTPEDTGNLPLSRSNRSDRSNRSNWSNRSYWSNRSNRSNRSNWSDRTNWTDWTSW